MRDPLTLLERPIGRRGLLRGAVFGVAGLAGAAIIGCSGDEDATPDAMADDGMDGEMMAHEGPDHDLGEAREFALVHGWHRGNEVVYYDFGMSSPFTAPASIGVAPIYAFITGIDAAGNPQFVEGQHNIVDTVPGDDGYSDLWEVNLVTVGADYVADSIASREDMDAMSYPVTKPGLFVNCPIVPAGSTLENGESLTQGWYRGEKVYYPDFGPNPPIAIPIWVFATGVDGQGNPRFVEGQHNIIDSVPGDSGYSAFWNVNLVMVDASYVANSIKSAADVVSAGLEVVPTSLAVNCPVVTMA